MEVLMYRHADSDEVRVKIVTPLTGFDHVWEKVVRRFASESGVGGLVIEINDNNATPYTAALRLRQGLQQAKAGGNL